MKRYTQKLPSANSVTYVGKGKLEEIKEYIHREEEEEREIGMVIFDDELSAKQIRNIEAELKVKILDRTSLILDTFCHACANSKCQNSSRTGSIQIYVAPSATLVDTLGASGRWIRCRWWKRVCRFAWTG